MSPTLAELGRRGQHGGGVQISCSCQKGAKHCVSYKRSPSKARGPGYKHFIGKLRGDGGNFFIHFMPSLSFFLSLGYVRNQNILLMG